MERDAIIGERLISWADDDGGERVRLGFEDQAGRPCAVTLPITLLSALMMTIPRMLHQALKMRVADGSMRMVHELGNWRVERTAGANASILSLTTLDGFEVTFAVAPPQADRLGRTLRHSAEPSSAVQAPAIN